jgi:hypothetical protein
MYWRGMRSLVMASWLDGGDPADPARTDMSRFCSGKDEHQSTESGIMKLLMTLIEQGFARDAYRLSDQSWNAKLAPLSSSGAG